MAQIGYRIRGIQPPDLLRYPDSVKLMYWGWVVDLGLKAKDKDLAAGLDKDGDPLRPLTDESIKHRKSEVGPTFKSAPPLEPSYGRSRVRSLLTGRAHTNSAEFWWKFDSVSGRSFAEILRYQRDEYDRDVFGLSPKGTAWVRAQALAKWIAWVRAQAGAAPPARPAITPGGQPVKRPIRKIPVSGRTDLENMDLIGDEAELRRAIKAGQFTGFRRLNTQGEKWFPPGSGIGYVKPPPAPRPPGPRQPGQGVLAVPPKPAFKPAPKPVPKPPPKVPIPAPTLTPEQHIADAVRYAESLGYEFTPMDQAAMKARGYQDFQIEQTPAFYSPFDQKLYINTAGKYWKDPTKEAKYNEAVKWWASPLERGPIDHEIGHRKHHESMGSEFRTTYELHAQSSFSNDEVALIKRDVSGYAATKPVEFVAEVQAGVKAGKRYSPEIWALYRRFDGPAIK